MTNEQKYKTPDELVKEFLSQREVSSIATVVANEFAHWLALEAEEEKTEPCPFCGGKTHINLGHLKDGVVHYWVDCISPECMYRSAHYTDKDAAISAHNRASRAVMAAKESEAGQ